jgi:hypothetical protein
MSKVPVIAITAIIGLAAASISPNSVAHAAPIYVCMTNPHPNTLWISLRFPNGGISNFQLPSGQSERRQGDSAGLLCSDSQPFSNASCPNAQSQARFACN